MSKILRHGSDGFTSPPKEGVQRIFNALKKLLPANFGSSGKHANHYKTEDDYMKLEFTSPWRYE
jgi:hypothetical protein